MNTRRRLGPLARAVAVGNTKAVANLTRRLLDGGMAPEIILREQLLLGMDAIGNKFRTGEVHVPEVLLASRALHWGLYILEPLLIGQGEPHRGKVILGTVAGDLHDIGKKLVGTFLKAQGVQVIDLGVDVSPEQFASAVQEHSPDFLAMSALLTTTMPSMAATIKELEREGLYSRVQIIVGGTPVTKEFAVAIGAHFHAYDAQIGAEEVVRYLKGEELRKNQNTKKEVRV